MKALRHGGGGRWLMFAGKNYEAAGGIMDFKGAHASLGDAIEWLKAHTELDWAQVVPKTKGRVAFFEQREGVWKESDYCECSCGHVLASKCGHRFDEDGHCRRCYMSKEEHNGEQVEG